MTLCAASRSGQVLMSPHLVLTFPRPPARLGVCKHLGADFLFGLVKCRGVGAGRAVSKVKEKEGQESVFGLLVYHWLNIQPF